MPGHDVVAIGASAGGLKALTRIAGSLPREFGAAVFVVQHLQPDHPTLLPQILSDTGSLPAALARDGDPIRRGTICIAPPDHHLLVGRESVAVVRGPRENRFRPSIDALFRSAARSHGPDVVGVVLSGHLDDGTVGLQAIKRYGGIAVVQDPREAEYPGMPGSALRYAAIDHVLTLDGISDFLARAPQLPVPEGRRETTGGEAEAETGMLGRTMGAQQRMESMEALGTRTPFTCPECHGALWQIGAGDDGHFRCHVGHAFSDGALLAEQTRSLESALWSAVRLMEEKAAFARRMAQRRQQANLAAPAAAFRKYADDLDREVAAIRTLIMRGLATQYVVPRPEEG